MDVDQDMGACRLTTLSTELIFHIVGYLALESHWNFALASKRTYACSAHMLKRHQEASLKYRVLSDRDPTTVPSMLRGIFGDGDPYPAFHVRSFEVWYDRRDWEEWIVMDDEHGYESKEQKLWEFEEGEWEDFLEPLEYGNGTSVDLEQARVQIEEGHDGILKAVLVANCPRLRDVKFSYAGINLASGDIYTVNWLELFIGNALRGANPWPPGLKSLRSIAMGVQLNVVPKWESPVPYADSDVSNLDLLAHLLRLPNIESISFGEFRSGRSAGNHSKLLPAGCSSVKHLYLFNTWVLDPSFCEILTAAPKGLVSTCFSANDGLARAEFVDLMIRGFSRHQGETLESLMFYGYYGTGRQIYRSNQEKIPLRPETFQAFKVLRHIALNMGGIQLDAKNQGRKHGIDKLDKTFLPGFIIDYLPQSIETLTLWGVAWQGGEFWEFDDYEDLENLLIEIVKPERFRNLKAVFVQDLERIHWGQKVVKPHKRLLFRNVVKIGADHGIYVDTLTNRATQQHTFDFPRILDEFDFQTGPWGARPLDWEFDTHDGTFIEPGCGKCGDCNVCLLEYGKELWDSIIEV